MPMASAPYIVQLAPDLALEAMQHGGFALLLDIPPGYSLGVDCEVFTVGPRFKGVKLLPPGTHFLSLHPPDLEGALPLASCGLFWHVDRGSVLVRQLDPVSLTLVELKDQEQVQRLTEGVRRGDLDGFLAPYNVSRLSSWLALSRLVTPTVLDQVNPIQGLLLPSSEVRPDLALDQPHTEAERKLNEQLAQGRRWRPEGAPPPLPPPTTVPESSDMAMEGPATSEKERVREESPGSGRCYYTHIDRFVHSTGATAKEITLLNMDKSRLLEQVVRDQYGGDYGSLLGELQYAFIAFVYGQSLEGLQQWKALVGLWLSCESAAVGSASMQGHFAEFLGVLGSQLEVACQPGEQQGGWILEGSLMEELLANSFLRHHVQWFLQWMSESEEDVQEVLSLGVRAFKKKLRDLMGWTFDPQQPGLGAESDGDEYAPVVVFPEEGT